MGASLDLESASLNLAKLKERAEEFEIEGLQIECFLHEQLNGLNNIVDVRFTNERSAFYKHNEIVSDIKYRN